MKILIKLSVWVCFVLFIGFPFLNAQQTTIVEMDSARSIIPEIQLGEFDNEVVTIEGFVTQWEEEEFRTMSLYWLRNRWGDVIIVRTVDDRPEVNQPYRVTGTVGVFGEPRRQQRYIDERRREPITDRRETAQGIISRAENIVREAESRWWINASIALERFNVARGYYNTQEYEAAIEASRDAEILAANAPYSNLFYLIIIAGIVLAILLVTLIVLVARKPAKTVSTQPERVQKGIPEPDYIQGETIKMHQPPPKTLKVLPGRFEIIAGDTKIKELRFFRLPEESDGEFTFGRSVGTPYKHIQIDNPTISREQAKLLYNNGKYTIVNRADPNKSNSTIINEKPMAMNELYELAEGDKVTMGVVTMVFHKK